MERAATCVALIALAASLLPLEGCVVDPCKSAKNHLCDKIQGMNCSTAFMDNAVTRLKNECGEAEAQRFVAYAEATCRAGNQCSADEGGNAACNVPACGNPQTFSYTGTAEADGRAAALTLTFTGSKVAGQLTAGPVCESSIRLTKTDISFPCASLTGGSWESADAIIQGPWTGGDYDCNGNLMADYPKSGTVTISKAGNQIILQRIAGAGKYIFSAQGLIYTPTQCADGSVVDLPAVRNDIGGACQGASITSVTPSAGSVGDTVTIEGVNFGATQGQVTFGSASATVVSWSNTAISVYVPTSLSDGTYTIAVTAGGTTCGTYADFTVYSGCVSAGTLVMLRDGTEKAIEKLAAGDKIYSLDPMTLEVKPAVVKSMIEHRTATYRLHRIKFSKGSSLLVTGNHPILTKGGRWVYVDKLQPGDVVFHFNPATKQSEAATILSIIRDETKADVVYNIKTTGGNYFAGEILVHNKCLRAGSLIDTPRGARAIESLKIGDEVYGSAGGKKVATRVTHLYTKSTLLESLPGKQLTDRVAVTINHQVLSGATFVEAGQTTYPSTRISGKVYDLQTGSGNYFADGLLLRAGD